MRETSTLLLFENVGGESGAEEFIRAARERERKSERERFSLRMAIEVHISSIKMETVV